MDVRRSGDRRLSPVVGQAHRETPPERQAQSDRREDLIVEVHSRRVPDELVPSRREGRDPSNVLPEVELDRVVFFAGSEPLVFVCRADLDPSAELNGRENAARRVSGLSLSPANRPNLAENRRFAHRKYGTPILRRVGGGRSRTRTYDPLIKSQHLL